MNIQSYSSVMKRYSCFCGSQIKLNKETRVVFLILIDTGTLEKMRDVKYQMNAKTLHNDNKCVVTVTKKKTLENVWLQHKYGSTRACPLQDNSYPNGAVNFRLKDLNFSFLAMDMQ